MNISKHNNRLYFKKLGLVYVYCPKAACTTLRAAFIRLNGGPDLLHSRDVTNYPYKRVSLKFVEQFKASGLVVGFTRNPLSRLYSTYRNKLLPDKKALDSARRDGDLGDYKNRIYQRFAKYNFPIGMKFEDFAKAESHLLCNSPFLVY
jgi:hypothetical protein